MRLFVPSQPCSEDFGSLDARSDLRRREDPRFPLDTAGSRSTDLSHGRQLGTRGTGLPTRLCYYHCSPHGIMENFLSECMSQSGKRFGLAALSPNLPESSYWLGGLQSSASLALILGPFRRAVLTAHPPNLIQTNVAARGGPNLLV